MKNKKIDPEESLEKFRTDLAEYSFMLEQQLKKIKPIKSVKKNENKDWQVEYNILILITRWERKLFHIAFTKK